MAYERHGGVIAAIRFNACRSRSGSACVWETGGASSTVRGLSGKIGCRVECEARASTFGEETGQVAERS
jgi:hypothetical protein